MDPRWGRVIHQTLPSLSPLSPRPYRKGLGTKLVLWTVEFWKLLNQNLTIQVTEDDERYLRSTVFNVLEGQTESFVASVVQFLRNSPLSSKATPNKFPVSRPPPASPNWSRCGSIIRLLIASQTRKRQFMSAMRPRFQGKWRTWSERNDLRPLLLQNAPAVDHL